MANITLKDGAGANLSMGVYTDVNGDRALGHVPLVAGAPVATGNPLPVSLPAGFATATAQATSNAALGAPADAEATGDGTLIALLKRIRTLLGGTLAVSGPLTDAQLRAAAVPVSGSAAVGVAPTLPPLSISGVDAGGLKRHLLTDAAGALVTAKPLLTETLTATPIVAAAAAVQVIAANANRKTLDLVVTGAGDIFFGYTSGVTASNGYPLASGGAGKQGGSYQWSLGHAPAGALYVFSTAGSTVIVKEGV